MFMSSWLRMMILLPRLIRLSQDSGYGKIDKRDDPPGHIHDT